MFVEKPGEKVYYEIVQGELSTKDKKTSNAITCLSAIHGLLNSSLTKQEEKETLKTAAREIKAGFDDKYNKTSLMSRFFFGGNEKKATVDRLYTEIFKEEAEGPLYATRWLHEIQESIPIHPSELQLKPLQDRATKIKKKFDASYTKTSWISHKLFGKDQEKAEVDRLYAEIFMWEMKAMSSEIESIIASIPGQENPPTTLTTLKKYLQDALTQNKKLSAIPKVYQEKMIEVIEQNNLTCPIFRYWEQFEAMHAKKRQIDRV